MQLGVSAQAKIGWFSYTYNFGTITGSIEGYKLGEFQLPNFS